MTITKETSGASAFCSCAGLGSVRAQPLSCACLSPLQGPIGDLITHTKVRAHLLRVHQWQYRLVHDISQETLFTARVHMM